MKSTKLALFLMALAIAQNTMANTTETEVKKEENIIFTTGFTDTEGFTAFDDFSEEEDINEWLLTGSLGPQFVYESKSNDWGENRNWQYSPVIGVIQLPYKDFSMGLEVKRTINDWQDDWSGKTLRDESWALDLSPRYYIGYYFGAPTDVIGNFIYTGTDVDNGNEDTLFEYSVGLSQRYRNLYTEFSISYDESKSEKADGSPSDTDKSTGFNIILKPYYQVGSVQLETEFYYEYSSSDKTETWDTDTFEEINFTPGIIKNFGKGQQLALRSKYTYKKTTFEEVSDQEKREWIWKATLTYSFPVTKDIRGMVEVEYEKAKEQMHGADSTRHSQKKIVTGFNYQF